MPRTAAATVDEYLQTLPEERRAVIAAMRALIRANIPDGYRESIAAGLIAYSVPLEVFPNTYNGQALWYLALAAQKNSYSLYLMRVYGDPKQRAELEQAFAKLGKKMDMGKSCLRFKRMEDLPLDTLAKLIASTPPETMIAFHEAAHR